jgi:hypothetical protein
MALSADHWYQTYWEYVEKFRRWSVMAYVVLNACVQFAQGMQRRSKRMRRLKCISCTRSSSAPILSCWPVTWTCFLNVLYLLQFTVYSANELNWQSLLRRQSFLRYWEILSILYNPKFRYDKPGSSVSIVSGYRLDDRVIEVRSPAEAKGFFLWPLCPYQLWVPLSLQYNGCQGVTLTTYPNLVPRSRMDRSYTFSLPKRLRGV